MNTLRTRSPGLVLAFPAACAAPGTDPPINSVGADAVGRWLHGPDGTAIGSVRSLSDGGRTANVVIGSCFEPGSHEAQVPVGLLATAGGQVVLQPDTVQALGVLHR